MGEIDPVAAVRRCGGTATTAQILELTGRRRLAAAVTAGRLLRVARGTYVLPDLDERIVRAAALHGLVSHQSAAQMMDIDLLVEPTELHVTVPHAANPRRVAGVVLHRTRGLLPSEVDCGLTAPDRTVLDCATTLSFAEALVVADGAVAARWVRPDDLRRAARASRGAGRPRRIRVADAADPRAHSVPESVLRAVLLDAGLTGFEPQHEIWIGKRLIRPDLADPRLRIALEVDSFAHHGSRADLERDCERYDTLTAAGWVVLRFTYRQVVDRPEWVVATVLAVCERAGGQRAGAERTVRA